MRDGIAAHERARWDVRGFDAVGFAHGTDGQFAGDTTIASSAFRNAPWSRWERESAGVHALPFYEAKRLESEGKLEEAAQRYADAQAADKDGLPLALMARIRVLKKLGKRDEALQDVARFEKEAPVKLSAMGGLWTTHRDAVVARSLRESLGENPPEKAPTKNGRSLSGLDGVLAYSLFLPGENPQVARFRNDPENRVYVRLNGDIKCLSLGDSPQTLWSTYVGTQVKMLASGENYLAAVSDREIAILDRETGEICFSDHHRQSRKRPRP